MTPDPATDAALARIAAVSGEQIAPATLLPARTILELSGEAVRSRLCTFVDAAGEEVALRPDMTTPIAVLAATGEIPLQRYFYSGTVYRLSQQGSGDATEFRQIGFEWFGGASAAEDAEALALTAEAVAAGGGAGADATLRFGDVALFRAVVDALPFSPRWRERLKRAFARRKGPRELLESAAAGDDRVSRLGAGLAGLSEADARRAVEEIFAMAGVQPVGGRDAAEIAERLRDVAADRPPPAEAAAALLAYLELSDSPGACLKRLDVFAREAGIKLGEPLAHFSARISDLDRLDPPLWSAARFSAEAGRRFEYYDGFVFDITPAGDPERPVAAGGRYDGLIAKLSSQVRTTTAIGAAIRAARLGGGR